MTRGGRAPDDYLCGRVSLSAAVAVVFITSETVLMSILHHMQPRSRGYKKKCLEGGGVIELFFVSVSCGERVPPDGCTTWTVFFVLVGTSKSRKNS